MYQIVMRKKQEPEPVKTMKDLLGNSSERGAHRVAIEND